MKDLITAVIRVLKKLYGFNFSCLYHIAVFKTNSLKIMSNKDTLALILDYLLNKRF